MPLGLLLGLVYFALATLFVFQWAGATARFNAVDGAAFEAVSYER